MFRFGGWSPEEPVPPEVTKICLELKKEIEKAAGTDFEVYTPLSFRSQVVAGTNYVVKVHISVNECVHALIFAPLPCNGGKLTVLKGKVVPSTDPLKPF